MIQRTNKPKNRSSKHLRFLCPNVRFFQSLSNEAVNKFANDGNVDAMKERTRREKKRSKKEDK